jgi:hypothetical protein
VRSAALLLALSACFQGSPEALDGDDDTGPSDGDIAECATAADCTGAAASCCECPTYAVSRASGWDDSCEEVCESPPSSCSAAPACAAGTCVLQCLPVTCGLTCPDGFAADSVGCLSCACGGGSPLPPAECAIDADCVQVPADCCGCAAGGADTAVPAGEAESFDDGLGCGTMEACPGVNVCDPEVVPRCLGGACALAAPPATDEPDPVPTGYCGSPDLPACPAGQVCVLNDPAAMDATAAGLGICRSQ